MLSVVHLSPTALSHTQWHCRHAQLGRRLLKGRIKLDKLYGIFLQLASLYASTITSHRICFNCSHSCEIPCILMFYCCLLLQSLSISLFASLAFWYHSLHLCIFSKLFALVVGVVCQDLHVECLLWVMWQCTSAHNLARLSLVHFLLIKMQTSHWQYVHFNCSIHNSICRGCTDLL